MFVEFLISSLFLLAAPPDAPVNAMINFLPENREFKAQVEVKWDETKDELDLVIKNQAGKPQARVWMDQDTARAFTDNLNYTIEYRRSEAVNEQHPFIKSLKRAVTVEPLKKSVCLCYPEKAGSSGWTKLSPGKWIRSYMCYLGTKDGKSTVVDCVNVAVQTKDFIPLMLHMTDADANLLKDAMRRALKLQ